MTDFAEHLQAVLGADHQLGRELPGGGMSRALMATDRVLGRRVVAFAATFSAEPVSDALAISER